jgi:hypothetical protein
VTRDYRETIRALRAKAADPAVPDSERKALNEKADKLEAKYSNSTSPFTYDTTVIGRDEFLNNQFIHKPGTPTYCADCLKKEEDIIEERFRDQPDEDYGYDIGEGDDY